MFGLSKRGEETESMTNDKIDTGAIHSLIAKREDCYRKHLEVFHEYQKASSELWDAINSLNTPS